MAENSPRIGLLPEDVRAKISSSCVITNAENVIEGLVTNALDADAQSIVVEADFARGFITCIDDGMGINEEEFLEQGNLVKSHCSSKFNTAQPTYGQYGRFLFNLSLICLLSISSQHRYESSASRLILHRGVVVSRQIGKCKTEVGLTRQGTSVIVHNLFGDLPVRFKQLSLRYSSPSETDRGFDRVKEILVGYILAYPRPVELCFSLKNRKQNTLRCSSFRANGGLFPLQGIVSILFQAKLLNSVDSGRWRSASVRTDYFSIRAAISTEPSPSKAIQFISIGQLPVRRGQGAGLLFDTIERLFEASTFGVMNDGSDDSGNRTRYRPLEQGVTDTRKLERIVDRWPMFYLRVDTQSKQTPLLLGEGELSADAVAVIDRLTKAIESLISHFLTASGFALVPRTDEARSTRPRTEKNQNFMDRGCVQRLDSELSRTAPEARFLSHWNRVKSARPSDESFRYGLGVDNSVDDLELCGGLLIEGTPLDKTHSHDVEGKAEDDGQTDGNDLIDVTPGLPWTNPRTGQVIRLNPRTGAVMLHAGRRDILQSTKCSGQTRNSEHFNKTKIFSFTSTELGTPQLGGSVISLQKYLRKTSFQQAEVPIRSITIETSLSSGENQPATGPGTTATSYPQLVTRSALSAARVIQQVDQKFVLIVVSAPRTHDESGGEKSLVVLVDQHAADERIKFEQLCQSLWNRSSVSLSRPLIFEVDPIEARILEQLEAYFQNWCLGYNIIEHSPLVTSPGNNQSWLVEVTEMPSLIAERCRAEPELLIGLMRRELWSGQAQSYSASVPTDQDTRSWWSKMAHCPEGMVAMLKSRSCRTAIMFNDVLDLEQCRQLVQSLARCSFPFQCAHGRPSLTIVADLDGSNSFADDGGVHWANDVMIGYGDAWRDWKSHD